ncbi:unnamed protein product [Strongylus vulgaris]|uniref:Globin domain-containing protein n=1 Tax=Strongylus vulgaris TaxID=40348 RepID=A0A3P7KDR5_STRVU|nr:unnamed protein product [Strongylus vulgaris]
MVFLRPTMGDAILKRAANNRAELRAFLGRLNDQQLEHMGKQFYSLIAESVEKIDRAELVQQHARAFGETYAGLCHLGFRPDFFAALADAAIAECVKLDGGAHKRCETLLAWSQLIGAIFTSVRDGYYSRVRYQRRIFNYFYTDYCVNLITLLCLKTPSPNNYRLNIQKVLIKKRTFTNGRSL